jgi:hypothetical protein
MGLIFIVLLVADLTGIVVYDRRRPGMGGKSPMAKRERRRSSLNSRKVVEYTSFAGAGNGVQVWVAKG